MARKLTQQEAERLAAGIRDAYETKLRQLGYRLSSLETENRNLRASLAEKEKNGTEEREFAVSGADGSLSSFLRVCGAADMEAIAALTRKWRAAAYARPEELSPAERKKYRAFYEDLAAFSRRHAADFLPEGGAAPDSASGEGTAEDEGDVFNMEDVLNPKGELSLEELCRGLGLMED